MSMKLVQQPRNTSDVADGLVLPEGVLFMDTTRGELRAHDGLTPGGRRLPNIETIQQLIASGSEGTVGIVQMVAEESELAGLVPKSNMLAVVKENGLEENWVWMQGALQPGDIVSSVDGFWRRVGSQAGFVIRMWRAGFVNLQVNGAQPAVDMDKTAWLVNNELKLWNGVAYVNATPATFTRMLAAVGGYFTGSAGVPNRLLDILQEEASVNAIDDTGWAKTKAGDANLPIDGVFPIFTLYGGTFGKQTIHIHTSADGDTYVRGRVADAWAPTWTYVAGQLPSRLKSRSPVLADADSQAKENGWAYVAADAAHIPLAQPGILTMLMSATGIDAGIQIYKSRTPIVFTYEREYNAGVYGGWNPSGMPTTEKATPVGADKLSMIDSADGLLKYTLVSKMWDRTNHTGVQALSTVSGLDTALNDRYTKAQSDARYLQSVDLSPYYTKVQADSIFARKDGAVFTGSISVRSAGNQGFAQITTGTTSNTGYLALYDQAATYQGYVGFGTTGGQLILGVSGASGWTVNGRLEISGYSNVSTTLNSIVAGGYTSGAMSGRAYPRRNDGTGINIVWSDPGGGPTYYLGSDNGVDFRPYYRPNQSVGYANSAGSTGNADTVGGVSWGSIYGHIDARVPKDAGIYGIGSIVCGVKNNSNPVAANGTWVGTILVHGIDGGSAGNVSGTWRLLGVYPGLTHALYQRIG